MRNIFQYSFLYFIYLLFVTVSNAQINPSPIATSKEKVFSLKGLVSDANNHLPLSSAVVVIPDLKLSAITDSMGVFSFSHLPKGVFLLEIKMEGYKSITKSIVITKEVVNVAFALQESVVEIGEVVVTGSSKATQIRRNPVPIISVNKDYLRTNLSTNIIDAIAKVPGVRSVTTGPNVSKPFIRGLGFNRILTLYDGIRQEGQQWGDEHGIEVDAYSIDKIEVIKGPASLTYGSDALAGVLNLIPTPSAADGTLKTELVTEHQSNNKYVGSSALITGAKNGWECLGRLSHKQAIDYTNPNDGRVFGTAFKETDAKLELGTHHSWGYSHLNFVLYDDFQEIPDGSRDSASRKFTRQITEEDTVREIVSNHDLNSYSIEKLHQRIQHYRVYSINSIGLGKDRLELNLAFQKSIRREFSHPVYSSTPGLYLNLNSYNYDIKYNLHEFGNTNLSIGVNGMYQTNTVTEGTEFIIPNYHQLDIGPFVMVKKSLGKLDILGGLRYDSRTMQSDALYTQTNPVTGFDMATNDATGSNKVFSSWKKTFGGASGSIGATYNFSEELSFKINVARGVRMPNISETSANGVHPGTNIYQIGNDHFEPEFSLQEDIGLVWASKQVVFQINVFNNAITHYIYNQKLIGRDGSDSIIGNNPLIKTFQYQSSNAHLYGGELNLDLHPIKPLHFENSLSIVDAINTGVGGKGLPDSEKYLPQIPPLHGISELRLDIDFKKLHIKNGFFKFQVEYSAKQNRYYAAYGTETATIGYTLFNAGLGGNIINKKGNTIASVSVLGNNLFDLAYQDHLSRLKYFEPYPNKAMSRSGIYNMGRNIAIKLSFPMSWHI